MIYGIFLNYGVLEALGMPHKAFVLRGMALVVDAERNHLCNPNGMNQERTDSVDGQNPALPIIRNIP